VPGIVVQQKKFWLALSKPENHCADGLLFSHAKSGAEKVYNIWIA
jgi:hypothetical protein